MVKYESSMMGIIKILLNLDFTVSLAEFILIVLKTQLFYIKRSFPNKRFRV